MKARERFEKIRKQKIGWFNLRNRLTLSIAGLIIVSVAISGGLSTLAEMLFPVLAKVPQWVQILVFSLLIALIISQTLSKYFFTPVKELREAMQKVADGDFKVQLQTNSSSVEVQEVYEGFNMMVQELGATEILQTDFVSNVSHEFKTPINAIEGYTMLLQSTDNIDEVENEYIEKILFNTKRLSSLVSNILLLSKIENQSIQTHQERFGMDEQIREAIVALEAAWAPKDIEFDVDLDDVDYYGNENIMHHVWSNIIGNAVKFSPRGGQVKIRLRKKEGKILFVVEDSGPGISDEAKKHLFDKFYQADTSHKEEGNGLGLALVKRILTLAGGEISAENIETGGCRFIVTLTAN